MGDNNNNNNNSNTNTSTPTTDNDDEMTYYKRIKVTNIPLGVKNQAFQDLCGKFGRVQAIELVRKNNNQIGFVSFITTEDAQYAVYRLKNYQYQNNTLNAYPSPLTKEQRDAKIEEEKRKRDEKEASFRTKPKKVRQPSKGSLRFLTPINPTYENGEFVQVGISIPARSNKRRNTRNNNQGENNSNQDQTETNGNQNKAPRKPQNQNNGNQNKGQNRNQNNGNQNNGNQNNKGQGKPQNKGQGKPQNQNNGQGKPQNNENQQQGKTKYRKKNQQQQPKAVVLAPSSDLIEETPMAYYEVTVRNTTTDQIVLRIQRRQDELDKPIFLKNEITF